MIERFQARIRNRKASDPKNRPDRILEVLKLQLGQRIADIGAGGGYFSLRFARLVGEDGRIYAVDTDPWFLKFIEEQARENGYANVETILVGEHELESPERDLDMVFMRNVCHHPHNRAKYLANLEGMLKTSGRFEFQTGNVLSIQFLDNSFDLVTSSSVINNLHAESERLKAIREIFRVSRPGGKFLLLEPLRDLSGRQTLDI
jgi:arsenite methyltransferase